MCGCDICKVLAVIRVKEVAPEPGHDGDVCGVRSISRCKSSLLDVGSNLFSQLLQQSPKILPAGLKNIRLLIARLYELGKIKHASL